MEIAGASIEELTDFHNQHSLYFAQLSGNTENYEIMCGQGAGLIKDVPSASEIIERMMRDIPYILEKVRTNC